MTATSTKMTNHGAPISQREMKTGRINETEREK